MFTPVSHPTPDSWATFNVAAVDPLSNALQKAAVTLSHREGEDIDAGGGDVLYRADGTYQLYVELDLGASEGITAPNTVSVFLVNNQANQEMDDLQVGSSKLVSTVNGVYGYAFPIFTHHAGDTVTIKVLQDAGPDVLKTIVSRAHVRLVGLL